MRSVPFRSVSAAALTLAALCTAGVTTATAAHADGSQGPKCRYAPTPVQNGMLSDLLCKRSDGSSGYAMYTGSDDTYWLEDGEGNTVADIVRSSGYDDADGVHHDFDVWDFNDDYVSAADIIKTMKSDMGYTHVYVDAMDPYGLTLIADYDVPSKTKH